MLKILILTLSLLLFISACVPAQTITSPPPPSPSLAPPTPIPSPQPTQPIQMNIYMVALGDAGKTGQEIGCEDSLVPVVVEIPPTENPVVAAYQTLLSIDNQFYGQSGLYNALYQSDLSVDSITLEDGTAYIHLIGRLMLGGVCDNPRVQAQLKEIALQFPQIERVEIFINDTPLEDLLSMRGNLSPSTAEEASMSQGLEPDLGWQRYENQGYGFRLEIPVEYSLVELPPRQGISFALSFISPEEENNSTYEAGLGLTVYLKPATTPFTNWFASKQGDPPQARSAYIEGTLFFDPYVENRDTFKGFPALQYEAGVWPVKYEKLIDTGNWVIGVHYLRDHSVDYEAVYEHILSTLEFFPGVEIPEPQPGASLPSPTPTVCLEEGTVPSNPPAVQQILQVQFINDGNIGEWEQGDSSARQITSTGDASDFLFSPDGQVIVFQRRLGDYTVELWAVDLDGGNLRSLVDLETFNSMYDEHHDAWVANLPVDFRWTPGTHRLSFGIYPLINALGANEAVAGYWIVDVDTTKLEETGPPPQPPPGLLSPDGSLRGVTDLDSLSIADSEGNIIYPDVFTFQSFPAEEGPGRYGPNIEWANDSRSLIAITYTEDMYSDRAIFTTWRVPVNGDPAQKLATFSGLPYTVYLSPNQKYLAYSRRIQEFSNTYELRLARLDGSKDVLYITLYMVNFIGWMPDGVHFLYDQSNTNLPQIGDLCAGPSPLLDPKDTPATEIRWVDPQRFLFVKGTWDYFLPRELRLGSLASESIFIGPYNGEFAQYRFEQSPLD